MTNWISAFPLGIIEGTSKVVGDLCSDSALTRIMAEVPLRDITGKQSN